MRKRKAESSQDPVQRKTHVGFKEMASEEDWNAIHAKTQEMLISNAQNIYNSKALADDGFIPQNGSTSPTQTESADTGFRQSSLLEHFKAPAACAHGPDAVKQKQGIISPPKLTQQDCSRCLRVSFSNFSKCCFCEKGFCPSCLGVCSRCARNFCSLCSQMDYTDKVDEKLYCLACLPQSK